jgi:hypothetical protein
MGNCICSGWSRDLAPAKKLGLRIPRNPLIFRAGPTRLELATSGVTGRRSNQLNYDPQNNSMGGTGLEPVTSGL